MSIETELGDRIGHVPDEPEQEQNGGEFFTDDRDALLGHLRAMRQEFVTADHKLDLDLPGFQGLVLARFRPYQISKSEQKSRALQQRFEKKEPMILDAACDTLIDACDQIMVRKQKGDDPFPIDDEDPIKFEARLAELFGFQGTRAREIVKAMFPTEQSIIAMSIQVTEWLRDVTKDADEEALGE